MGFDELKSEALKLSPEFRAILAKELLASLDSMSETELEGLWVEEAIRRDDEMDRDVGRARPSMEVLDRAKARRR